MPLSTLLGKRDVQYDPIMIFWLVFSLVYTVLLLAGLAVVWLSRKVPAVRMRNVPVVITSSLFLHVYHSLILNGYGLSARFPCRLEYWAMSLWFPLGIGLFQLQNTQLLIRSMEQNQLLCKETVYRPFAGKGRNLVQTLRLRWNSLSYQKKYSNYLIFAMIIQVAVSLAIYLASRRFHGSFGVFGEEVDPIACRRGWEWLPTTAWQFIWTWIFAPYFLWKIRLIDDIYHWRAQTIVTVIASLPGSPLWIAATYSSAFDSVNRYWIPPMWFVPSLICMQWIPLSGCLRLVWKHRKLQRMTAQRLQRDPSAGSTTLASSNTAFTEQSTATSGTAWTQRKQQDDTTMKSLEHAIDNNPHPLLHFAATKEFSGENIRFLVTVRAWKNAWLRTLTQTGEVNALMRRNFWISAVEIYMSYVDATRSEYTVNVESHIYKTLAQTFGEAMRTIQKRNSTISNQTAPWEVADTLSRKDIELVSVMPVDDSVIELPNTIGTNIPGVNKAYSLRSATSCEPIVSQEMETTFTGPTAHVAKCLESSAIPNSFDHTIFDNAEASVRHLVLVNTWRNYQRRLSSDGSDKEFY